MINKLCLKTEETNHDEKSIPIESKLKVTKRFGIHFK